MGFADQYLQRQNIQSGRIDADPSPDLLYTVVIPCYNEPGIMKYIDALHACDRPENAVEIIVVVNTPQKETEAIKMQNLQTYKDLLKRSHTWNEPGFRLYPLWVDEIPRNQAGVGYARKAGMNEAIRRFNILGKPEGIILSLDADACCDNNYFTAIEQHLYKNPQTNGFTFYFEHPIAGKEFEKQVYEAITYYELDLRYFVEGMRYAGFPYAFHTIGSCFGVKALAYVKQGGMNLRQGGEDFYFLHKIIPMGQFYEINNTRVMPSSRPSDRVPFGTGPWISKYLKENDMDVKTYNIRAFDDLKVFFKDFPGLFHAQELVIEDFLQQLSPAMVDFLYLYDFQAALSEINKNCAKPGTFNRKLLHWFDAFRIVKYMHFVHEKYYKKESIVDAINTLLAKMGKNDHKLIDPRGLLDFFRDLQK